MARRLKKYHMFKFFFRRQVRRNILKKKKQKENSMEEVKNKDILKSLREKFMDILELGYTGYGFGYIGITSRLPMIYIGTSLVHHDDGSSYTEEEVIKDMKEDWIATLRTLIDKIEKA